MLASAYQSRQLSHDNSVTTIASDRALASCARELALVRRQRWVQRWRTAHPALCRCGDELRLNPHLHKIFADDVWHAVAGSELEASATDDQPQVEGDAERWVVVDLDFVEPEYD